MVAVCPIEYFEVGVIHPGGQTSLSIVSVLCKSLEAGVEFRNYVREMELIDKVKWWDIFFIVFQGIVYSWGRRRGRGNLFDERRSWLGFVGVRGLGCSFF